MKKRSTTQKRNRLNDSPKNPDLRTAKTQVNSELVWIFCPWWKYVQASHLMNFFQFIKRQCFGEDRHRFGEIFPRFQVVHQRFGIDFGFHNSWLISGLT